MLCRLLNLTCFSPLANTQEICCIRAGQDTTASALAWLVKFLPQDPEIQRQLRNKVCAIFGQDGELNYEAIDDSERVPVLEAVVAETLRCAQLVAQTGREREWHLLLSILQ